MTRGLLLLDVDGPLNPYAATPHRRPPGYHTFRRTPSGAWYSGRDVRRHRGLRVWLNPAHGAMLRDCAAASGLDLAWATTWLHEANTRIGPVLGLPELPVIEFPRTDLDPVRGWLPGGSWKWRAVADYADGRPLAWLDDEHDQPEFPTARRAFLQRRTDIPTALCHVDPARGLHTQHLATIQDWADNLS
ncbi:HAD domain-containing protein [Streptoalloteichus hindustanus]|uniref:Secreted protein n=1 Tax=Streptoalloteichus hindustanus TaxID=2017 RepID=A0A1M5MD38_STRHI|nr:HAD domain-containing protein [Streptoalloteichus hindustanus]SHG74799.1 hypothetical protein SAMN05444320_11366 [Streptoalloteichus hindustanus]